MDGKLIAWHGGEHRFLLRLGELRTLQKNCGAGPERVFNRLRLGDWEVDDVLEPIRLGLVGSDEMTTNEAGPYVVKIAASHPIIALKLTALAIMSHSLLGDPDDPVGEDSAGETETAPDGGVSPASTETAP